MKNNRAVVYVDVKTQAADLQKTISNVQNQLGNLHLNPKIEQDMTRALKGLINDLQAVSNTGLSGLTSDAAIKTQQAKLKKIEVQFSNTISQIKGLNIKPEDIFPDDKDYEKVYKELDKAKKKVEQKTKEIKDKTSVSGRQGYVSRLKKSASEGDVATINKEKTQQLKSVQPIIEKSQQEITEVANKLGLTFEQMLDKIKADYKEYQTKTTSTEKSAMSRTEKYQIGDLNTARRKYLGGLQSQEKIIADADSFKQDALDIQGLNQDVDAANLNVENLSNTIAQKVKTALQELYNTEQTVTQGTQNMSREFEKGSKDLGVLTDKAKNMNQLKSYFTQFFSATQLIMKLGQAVRGAIEDFKALDKQFNEISIVTGKTMQELWGQFTNLNATAQEYGVTVNDVVSVQKIYYQQGRSMAEVTKLTGETLTFAKISGLDFAEATDFMTASINAYKIAAEDASKITDTFAALSTEAAVDANEVAVAMSKVASLAAGAGSSFEDTSAYLAKIIETTREAPETAGTALKTIIARFTEVKDLTEEEAELLEDDFNFNNIEKALKTVGIQSKDANGQLRGFGDILNDLGPIWDDLTNNQKRYIATAAAGARQQSRFIALMDDWGRTQELQGIATNSSGIGAKQLALSLESIETSTNRLKSTWQEFYTTFLKSDMFKGIIDSANTFLKIINELNEVPVFGPALVTSFLATSFLLTRKAINFGKDFAKGFELGRKTVEKKYGPIRDTTEAEEAVRRGTIAGTNEAIAKEKVEQAKQKIDEIQAIDNGIAEGTKEGTAKALTQAEIEERIELRKQKLDELQAIINGQKEGQLEARGKALGSKLGEVVSNIKHSQFVQGMAHPLTVATKGGTGAALSGASGGVAGAAGVAGAVVGGVAIAALLTTAIAYGIEKYRQKAEQDILEAATKASESIDGSVKKITDISKAYTKSIELQRKGLLKTEEEMQEYQSELQSLQETYPQLVKVMSDGTLELAANASALYDTLVNQERSNIRMQSKALYEAAGSTAAVASGLALTEESQQLQSTIQSVAANLSTFDNLDFLDTEGAWGDSITADNLAQIAEKGLNRQTLNEAVGNNIFYGINQSEYENLLRTAAGEGGSYDKESQEYRFLKVLAEQSGKTLEEFAKILQEGSGEEGAAEQKAVSLANSYASQYNSTLTSDLKTGIIDLFKKSQDQGATEEAQVEAYFKTSGGVRAQFENYLNDMFSDVNLNEISKEFNASAFGFFGQSAEVAKSAYDAKIAELEKQQATLIEQYNQATGKSITEFTGTLANMSYAELSGYVATISQVANRYGRDSGEEFEKVYAEFKENVLKGNTDLANSFGQVDWFDSESIAEFGAEIAAKYGEASDAYLDFVDVVNKSSAVLDRDYQTAQQFVNGVANDIESIKKSMDDLGSGLSGELALEDVFRLIGSSNGKISFEDFTETAKGYEISQEKAAELREIILKTQILEYKIQQQLTIASIDENMKKLEGLGISQDRINSLLAEYKLNLLNGEAISAENQALLDQIKLGKEGESYFSYFTSILNNQETVSYMDMAIEQIGKINFEINETDTTLGRLKRKLEKILELLKGVDFYSDVDAYLKELELSLESKEFVIEFSTNINDISKATIDKINNLNEQVATNLAKANKAASRAAEQRGALEDNWGQYVSFDDQGNILTNGAEITKWQERIAKLYGSDDEVTQQKAEAEEKRLDLLLEQIDAYREEKALITETKNKANELLKTIKETTDELHQNVKELEDKFLELFIGRDEEILKSLEERYDAMKQLDDDYLESVRDAVEEERRLRDQEKSYDDLAKMERQLALLKMSGGSATQIQELEQQIADARQDINDTEIDNVLNALEKENETRANYMDEEVSYQQSVLEAKKENQIAYNAEIASLMAQDKETILNTWKALDKEFVKSTTESKILLEQEMDAMVTKGLSSKNLLAGDYIPAIETAYENVAEEIGHNETAMSNYVDYVNKTSGGVVSQIGAIENAYFNAAADAEKLTYWQQQYNKALSQQPGVQGDVTTNDPDGNLDGIKNNNKFTITDSKSYSDGTTYYKISGNGKEGWVSKEVTGLRTSNQTAMLSDDEAQRWSNSMSDLPQNEYKLGTFGSLASKFITFYDDNGDKRKHDFYNKVYLSNLNGMKITGYMEKGALKLYRLGDKIRIRNSAGEDVRTGWINQTELQEIIKWQESVPPYMKWKLPIVSKYASGGLVDFTGPAWVDGTKSKPEAFLSAKDTSLIAGLRDVLRINFSTGNFGATGAPKNGDVYYQIQINVDELGDEYTVDDLMTEVEERIIQASTKNNVIKIN